MLSNKVNPKITPAEYLMIAAKNGRHDDIKKLLKDLSSQDVKKLVNTPDKNNDTALHLAVTKGHIECVILLLQYGTDPNSKGFFDDTPLHCAARKNHADIAYELLNAGADYQQINNDRAKPIHVACREGATEVIKQLAERNKEQLNWIWKEGRTPFYCAAMNGQVNTIKLLCDLGEDVNQQNLYDMKNTALHLAAKNGDVELAKILIANGAEVDKKDGGEFTPLQRCAMQPDISYEVAEVLVESGASVDAGNNNSPIILLASCKDQESEEIVKFAKLLISRGCNMDATNLDGETALEILKRQKYMLHENELGLYKFLKEQERSPNAWMQGMRK
jgi:ankyrin repeat protein